MKSKVDKLAVDKLVPVSVDLSKLSHVVKNDIVKKDVYNAKIKNIEDKIPGITSLATKATRNAKINKIKGKISSATILATTAAPNTEINEVKGKIPSITNLASTTALTCIEIKIPNVSNLVKETDYNTKKSEIERNINDNAHDKFITTPEFNRLTAEKFTSRLARVNLAIKSDIVNFVKKTDFDEKLKNVTSNKIELN